MILSLPDREVMANTSEAGSKSSTAAVVDSTPSKIIKVESNDGEIFDIDQGVVEQSSTIKTLSDCE